ncbi:transferase [Lithospermum erythrorhizon]|uniref:Glycosyltransferase n=1 Tax=Lithospermum erythrorhizon TaxID=34254 RepID=A0AAV3RQ66_LITER
MEAPHVVVLPFPAQGHIKPMFMLAKLLSHAGIHISFINTEHTHKLMLQLINQSDFHNEYPNFEFISIPDGLPLEHQRTGISATDLFATTQAVSKPFFRDLIGSLRRQGHDKGKGKTTPPPSCIIADGIMSFAVDVAEELNLPVISFRTYNATSAWVYFHLEELIQQGELPVTEGDEDMEKLVQCIPALENTLRRRDLPKICRLLETTHPFLQFFIEQAKKMKRASALILNTFQELEAPMVSQLCTIFPKVYTIGPLHSIIKKSLNISNWPSSIEYNNGSLRQEDETCISWLDSQAPRSVLYVSFGSIVVLTREQILEFWHGLVNSGKPFLWVLRLDGPSGILDELRLSTSERGRITNWAPQEKVLGHASVGGFLTHSGWNSTLESIAAGVPMICWPQIAEQQVNSRCVSEMWNIGLDMKDSCDRLIVEKMVIDLMEDKKEEFAISTERIARLASDSIEEDGSSYLNIKKLIEDLHEMNHNL